MSRCCGGNRADSNETVDLNVKGMTCEHCVMSIKKGLGELKGVKNVEINLQEGRVSVEYNSKDTNVETIKETIDDIGYEVTG